MLKKRLASRIALSLFLLTSLTHGIHTGLNPPLLDTPIFDSPLQTFIELAAQGPLKPPSPAAKPTAAKKVVIGKESEIPKNALHSELPNVEKLKAMLLEVKTVAFEAGAAMRKVKELAEKGERYVNAWLFGMNGVDIAVCAVRVSKC